jgi:DNA-binding transcriptional LysR family regulator
LDRWTQIELFVHAAELGSLSKAAEALALSNAAASRYLAALEQRLSARLIERNTRRLWLTEIGEGYYRHCKNMLGETAEAESAVRATALNPSGTLRVTASVSFSMKHVAPLLPEFARRYPNVKVEILAANRYYDLIDSGIDVAIRTKEYEADSNLTVRRLAETRRTLAASPAYLEQHGEPKTICDLGSHDMLLYTLANNPHELSFKRDNEERCISVNGVLTSNDGQVLRAAALAGLGILIQPNYIIHDDVVAGRLIPVLNEWHLPRLTINVAYQSRRHVAAKIRAFIDFMVEHFRQMDYESKWTA